MFFSIAKFQPLKKPFVEPHENPTPSDPQGGIL